MSTRRSLFVSINHTKFRFNYNLLSHKIHTYWTRFGLFLIIHFSFESTVLDRFQSHCALTTTMKSGISTFYEFPVPKMTFTAITKCSLLFVIYFFAWIQINSDRDMRTSKPPRQKCHENVFFLPALLYNSDSIILYLICIIITVTFWKLRQWYI